MTARGDSVVPSRYRFKEFEVDLRTGELFKRGVPVKLAEQPLQVLSLLLENSGELVAREELCRRLWPDDTYVDFERGLNTAVRTLRRTLGDTPKKPRFIETLPKRGYRFIAPVERVDSESGSPAGRRSASAAEAEESDRRRLSPVWAAAAALGLVSLGVFAVWSPSGSSSPQRADELVAALPDGLTHVWGAVSPDARRLARRGGDSEWLYVVDLVAGVEKALVERPVARQMAWSPDGDEVAFVAEGPGGEHRLQIVDLESGERRDAPGPALARSLAEVRVPVAWDSPRNRLLLSGWRGDWIGLLDLDSGELDELDAPRELISRDMSLSPDGRLLAAASQDADIVVHRTDGSAEPVLLVSSPQMEAAPVWSRDGASLLFLRQPGTDAGQTELWAVPVDRGTGRATGESVMLAEAPDPRLGVPPIMTRSGEYVWAKQPPVNRLAAYQVDPETGIPSGAAVDEIPRGYWGGTWSDAGAVLRVDSNLDWPIRGMTAFRELDVATGSERRTEVRQPDLKFSRVFYSRDLTKAAVRVSPPDGGSSLYLYDTASDGLTEVLSSGPRIWSAWLSHDSRRIAFLETEVSLGEAGTIAVADIETRRVRRLYSGAHVEKPVWSPDDSEVAFADRPCIRILDIDSGDLEELTCYEPPPEVDVRVRTASPDWSPDGSMLVWGAINRSEKRHELWVVDRSSGERRIIWSGEPNYKMQAWSPQWSADGRYIAFSLMDPPPVEIWKIRHPLIERPSRTASD